MSQEPGGVDGRWSGSGRPRHRQPTMSMSFFTFPVPRFLFRGSGDARDDKAHQQSRQKEAKANKTYDTSDHQQQVSG